MATQIRDKRAQPEPKGPMVGRLAPSPTGSLHLGGASTFLVAWLEARSRGGQLLMRMEDLDQGRSRPEFAKSIPDDLRWLGLDWDEGPAVGGGNGPYQQSERTSHYAAALAKLEQSGQTYRCDCSRKDIARALGAPHASDGLTVYPGTCRSKPPAGPWKKPPAIRLRLGEAPLHLSAPDLLQLPHPAHLQGALGDVVLKRSDGGFAYHLAVVVDDGEQGVSQVVRGADLHAVTPLHLHLQKLLGLPAPEYLHAPLVLDSSGERLAKRRGGVAIAHQRQWGRSPETIVGALAHMLGLSDTPQPLSAQELLGTYRRENLRKGPVQAPATLFQAPSAP